jgi:phosphoglycolate phosphatase
MTVVAFDLDGTLSNPSEGITASINYALEKVNTPRKNPIDLTHYIGPPLNEIFSELLNTKDTKVIGQAISYYRERYFSIGYRENVLYQDIEEMLEILATQGLKLYVATSKRTDIAESVVNYFGLQKYFIQVLGCGLKRKKHELLEEIIKLENNRKLLMIGDRSYDILAGKEVGAKCVGVLWGYGSAVELKKVGADILVQNTQETLDYIETLHDV